MSIASMTGFARVNGQTVINDENISWVWEIKSVNGKSLEMKTRLPAGYDDLGIALKNEAAKHISRGSVNVGLELIRTQNCKNVLVNEGLLVELTQKAIELNAKYDGKVGMPSAAELLNLKGVIELQENIPSEDEQEILKQKVVADFTQLCQNLRAAREVEGQKIAVALNALLDRIENIVGQIEKIAEDCPDRMKQKLEEQLAQYAKDVSVSEERIAQELVLLVTRADIREEIDRLKAHIKAARELLAKNEAVGRRLDFLCQELNREANTTCSKSTDIATTNFGMELKVLIEQFREQVQNIE